MRSRLLLLILTSAALTTAAELRFCLRAEPKTLNPLLVADESSETIRYLTGGVLIRFNRLTQALEPELATSWRVMEAGRKIDFHLREGVSFSDGTPFSAEDVAFTMRSLLDPQLHSPTGDSFRSSEGSDGSVEAQVLGPHRVVIVFPAPVAALERLFDQVAILSSRSALKEKAVLGPFVVTEHKPGAYLRLSRNPQYWKRDAAGRPLPYLDAIRLDIQANRDLEILRFRRGEVHLINTLDPDYFDRLTIDAPALAHDAGPSLDTEQMWFNQVSAAPLPAYKKAWFRSQAFRRAVSEAINRQDLCRVALRGRGQPAAGPVSPANRIWFRQGLEPHRFDPQAALRRLQPEGFRHSGGVLRDREGHPVEFSLITNAGNKIRERMAAMMQQDLGQIGVRVNVVTMDFASLIERLSRSFDYEACLLGLVNVDVDPSGQMNIWLSSASQHQWNPNQKSPETPWEAEIDRLMKAQASTIDPRKRKASFDRVQEIVWEQAPFLYLVHRNALSAVSASVQHATPVALRPQTFWNIERMTLGVEVARSER